MLVSIPLAALLAAAALAQDQAGGQTAAAVAPVVGEEVAAVVHLDLTRLDARAISRRVLGDLANDEEVAGASNAVAAWVDALKASGAKELFLLLDPADIPGMPLAVVPLAAGADAQAISGALTAGVPNSPLRWPAGETVGGVVVAGTPDSLGRVQGARSRGRPDFSAALAAGGPASIQIMILPSATQRRALEESLASLPAELGGGPITILSRGLTWASFALVLEPRPALRVVVQAPDAGAAQALAKAARDALDLLAKTVADQPELAAAIGRMRPAVQGDRVTLEADPQKTAELLAVPVRQAREVARRTQCVNNLKQIALAMHDYHSAHNSFPAAYNTSRDGKPLLSWRVHLLPYLEQKALHDEFHLDEPWDSPHNRTLISRMPRVYACPGGSRELAAEGRTSYLVPRGPATIFPGAEGIRVKDVTDGTSNTILFVDAGDALAVPWTRPVDWDVAPEIKPPGLFGHHPRGTNFGLVDGSVRFLKQSIAPRLLQGLTTRNGGEVLAEDE